MAQTNETNNQLYKREILNPNIALTSLTLVTIQSTKSLIIKLPFLQTAHNWNTTLPCVTWNSKIENSTIHDHTMRSEDNNKISRFHNHKSNNFIDMKNGSLKCNVCDANITKRKISLKLAHPQLKTLLEFRGARK